MTDFRVTLYTEEGEHSEVVIEGVDSRDVAIDAALEQLGDDATDPALRRLEEDDVVEADAVPLCDFCKAAPHERVEGYGFVLVTDPSDVMDLPLGEDPPERELSACGEHLDAIQSVPPTSAATDGGSR